MNWLAGETKWWLLLAAVLGALLTWLFMLRKVQTVSSTSTASATGLAGGPVGLSGEPTHRTATEPAEGADVSAPVVGGHVAQPVTEPEAEPEPWASPNVEAETEPEAEPEPWAAESADTSGDGSGGSSTDSSIGTETTGAVGLAGAGSHPGAASDESAVEVAEPDSGAETEPEAEPVAEPGGRPTESRFGAGTADPMEDGSSPHADFTIKGNADSMKFHTTESPYYGRTIAEVWFDSEESATAAGFHRWDA